MCYLSKPSKYFLFCDTVLGALWALAAWAPLDLPNHGEGRSWCLTRTPPSSSRFRVRSLGSTRNPPPSRFGEGARGPVSFYIRRGRGGGGLGPTLPTTPITQTTATQVIIVAPLSPSLSLSLSLSLGSAAGSSSTYSRIPCA
jgi:hypothetical protein